MLQNCAYWVSILGLSKTCIKIFYKAKIDWIFDWNLIDFPLMWLSACMLHKLVTSLMSPTLKTRESSDDGNVDAALRWTDNLIMDFQFCAVKHFWCSIKGKQIFMFQQHNNIIIEAGSIKSIDHHNCSTHEKENIERQI